MKRKVLSINTLVVLTLVIFVMISSCDRDNSLNIENNLSICHEYNKLDYLDLSNYTDLYNLSERDQLVLHEAEKRINIQLIDGQFRTLYTEGAELNMSESLFNYISANYNHLNTLRQKTKSFKRIKKRSPEPTNPYEGVDCVPIAISHYCNIPYQEAIDSLVNKHLTLLEAVRIFKKDAKKKLQLNIGDEKGIIETFEHVVNLEKVKRALYGTKLCYQVYYKDWQRFSDGGNGLYFYVDTLKFPCKNIVTKNDTIIYGLVQ